MGSGPTGIVTPEAVVLDIETAGLASRMLSGAIDLTVQVVLLLAVLAGAAGLGAAGGSGGLGPAAAYLALFGAVFCYPAALETLWRGRTLGKAALGLRVVTVEGGPVRFRHAAIRAILGLVDKLLLSGGPGILSILLTPRNQRLGDLVAGTIVLRERAWSRAPTAVRFAAPPGLEGYAASLDTSGLGHQDYLAVRSFLIRSASLTPSSRADLALRLAVPLQARLRTTPPAGLHPEAFLVCVASAFQDRGHQPGAPAFASVWSDLGTEGERAAGPAPGPLTGPEPAGRGFAPPA